VPPLFLENSETEEIQLVMPQFGSEPRFEPEPAEPNAKFSSRFRDLPEPNLKSSSRFSQHHGGSNLNRTLDRSWCTTMKFDKFYYKFRLKICKI